MQALCDGMLLYHGSYTEVSAPSLSRCARFKDFGQGFYLTSSKAQAESFARLSTRKAKENGLVDRAQASGTVSIFRIDGPATTTLEQKLFSDADAEWLRCIAAHRRIGSYPAIAKSLEAYDIIGGKVANDQTNNTLTIYLAGGFGQFDMPSAIETCVRLLLPERLKDQYCFRTNAALAALQFEGGETVWL